MKLKKSANISWDPDCSDDFWYAIQNGYIKTDWVVGKAKVEQLERAVELLTEFENVLIARAEAERE